MSAFPSYDHTLLKHLRTLWKWGRHNLCQHDYDEIRPFAEIDAVEENCSAINAGLGKRMKIAGMAGILRAVAYPRRGTEEERMTLQEAANQIQANWTCGDLEDMEKFEQAGN